MPKILVNAIRTPDGTILRSRHRHDFVSHKDSNGCEYSVDGGVDYLKRSRGLNAPPARELSLFSDDPHDLIREWFDWGTYGKNGDDPLKHILLKDLTTEHIKAIIDTQHHLPDHIKQVFLNELEWRKAHEE